ncbi:antifreeze glycopeptide afgp related protein [Xanthomonas campestris pv. raphani 756C]|nr:antifreeze glycopeptide afgp related protein [Xanthomonas campestris pv. raphani 756C]
MSALFEQFLAGEDGISVLLRALPAYAPPAGMDAWFVQAARAASVAHAAPAAGATQAQAGSAPVIRAAGAQTFDFEPPASLQAAFSAAAAQADQTQASQRQAVQRQLAHGGDAVQAVGAPLSAQARAWIDAQQHVELAERPTAFVRSVSSRGDVPSDSEPYTGTAAPAALSDLAEATSARRLEINSNNKTDSDSDSDSDNHRLGKHVHAHAAQASSAPVPQPASERDTREVAAAATTQAPQPAMADTHVPATPALRSTRRRRWMPTLAFAASITLAVGVGLQWQAHQPVPDAAMDVAPAPPSDAHQATTDSGQPPLPMAQLIDAPAASSMAVQAPIDAPASARASAPPAPPSPAEAPAVTVKSPPAPAPPLAPAVARPAAAPAPPAPYEFAVAAAPSLPEPMAEGNAAAEAAPTAAPPPPAPIAASQADASADASLAQTTPMRPAAMPRTAAAAEADAPTSVMDRSRSTSSISPADMASVPAATVVGQFSASARRAPLIHNDAQRDIQSAPLPAEASLAMQVPAKPSPAPRPAGEVVALSVRPTAWFAQRAPNTAPPRIRLWAAAPDAPAVQRWAAGLRKQIQQRGWTTRVDVLQDTQLAADQLRVDVSSSNAQE